MSSIAFVDNVTVVPASWFNDANRVLYTLFGNGVSLNTISGISFSQADLVPGRLLLSDPSNPGNTALRFVPNGSAQWDIDVVLGNSSATEKVLVLNRNGGRVLVGTSTDDTTSALQTPTLKAIASVVTPLVDGGVGANLQFRADASTVWQIDRNSTPAGLALSPIVDNVRQLGDATHRVSTVFTPIIDTGTTGALSLKTNNGTEQTRIVHTASAVNFPTLSGSTAGNSVRIGVDGTDTNVDLALSSKGTGIQSFYTNSVGALQFQVLHTPSANRNITVTGGNSTPPTLDVTAGGILNITPSVALASTLKFSTAASKIIPGATSLALRNTADSANNVLINDNGDVFTRANISATTGMAVSGATAQGGGLAFPASQVAVANANTLDDYAEGTWTPGISFGGGTTGITYSSQQGTFTKIGRTVFLHYIVTLSAKGSSTGAAAITGLPFSANTIQANSIVRWAIMATAFIMMTANPSGTTAPLEHWTAAITGPGTGTTDTSFNNTSSLSGTLMYHV